VTVDPLRQSFYTFNSKSGVLQRHNLQLQVVLTKQLHKEEVTAYTWAGHKMEALVLGFADGMVRVYEGFSEEEEDMAPWEQPVKSFEAFTNVQGKKGAVSVLKVHRDTGALYGASTQGNIKLLAAEV
jgi:hypothetical protein